MRGRCKARAVVAGRVDERGNNRAPLRASEVMRLGEMWEWRRSRIKSSRPRSTSPLAGVTQFPAAFLPAPSEPRPAGRRAAHLRSV